MELGIIGLAKSGKSTVFNTLTRGRVSTASGASAKSNIGTAKVPDGRLSVLAGIFRPKRVTNAEVQYTDLLNTPEGLGKDHGIGGEYFNVLQRVDALVHVVRAFENPAVPHIQGNVDPLRDIVTLDLELTFSDVAILERRLERLDAELKGAKAQERDLINRESAILKKINQRLLEETPLREQELTDEEKKQISALQLLTAKPSTCASKRRRRPVAQHHTVGSRPSAKGQPAKRILCCSLRTFGRRAVPDGRRRGSRI